MGVLGQQAKNPKQHHEFDASIECPSTLKASLLRISKHALLTKGLASAESQECLRHSAAVGRAWQTQGKQV